MEVRIKNHKIIEDVKIKEDLIELKDMIYSRKIICPICRENFTSMKVMESKLRVEESHTDLFIKYKGDIHPLKYNSIVCPKCGYAALESKFNKILPRHHDIIKEKVSSKWVFKDYTGKRNINESIICFKLALYCAELTKSKKIELAGICLKIAWLYRMQEDEKENKFMKLSVELYEASYSSEDSEMDEITLTYLMGEIYRRLGEIDKATSWLGKVISNPYIKSNPKIEKLAREQWQEIKELSRAE